MPSNAAVDGFIAQVLSGDHAGAILDWYHEDAWMQENQAAPREGGRTALVNQEKAMLDACELVETECLSGPLMAGDCVAIRWRFTFHLKDGRRIRQEEVAWQRWRGDRICEETFFYDPAQRNAG